MAPRDRLGAVAHAFDHLRQPAAGQTLGHRRDGHRAQRLAAFGADRHGHRAGAGHQAGGRVGDAAGARLIDPRQDVFGAFSRHRQARGVGLHNRAALGLGQA